ncbi:hypothetical protein ACOI1C_22270 [Bacillus sp. DJP31]|uniref:hypothetical protein n=1 Tax=Bacillus sp. DJP31 TaxID=3409789 RepID=UPI003BB7D164
MFFSLTTAAFAHKYNYGYSFDVIGFKCGGSNCQYIASSASMKWNDAANTRIGEAPYANNLIAHYEYSDNWLGLYKPNPVVAGGVTEFSIHINKRTISDYQARTYPNSTYYTIAISTAVHELGHALFLNDQPDGTDTSVMSYYRIRTNTTPRYHDVQDVKSYRGY